MNLTVRILMIWLALGCILGQAAAQISGAGSTQISDDGIVGAQISTGATAAMPSPRIPQAADSAGSTELEPWFDEVHVRPRVTTESNPQVTDTAPFHTTEVSSSGVSLRTYTKPITVDVDLVLVPVSVTDAMNRMVTGLEKNYFVLLDNGQRQEIKYFSSEDAPISLGVIFDVSGSMEGKIKQAQDAVGEFFKTANPEDEFFLITFSDAPEVLADFTRSVGDIQSKLVFARPKGSTALLDAIYLGISKMRRAKYQRKALLIISDGGDNHSRYTEGEIKSLVREADVEIYALGMFSSAPRMPEEQEGPELLSQVAEVTGGRMFTIDNPNQLGSAATKIGAELRNQYVLGYRPSNSAHDGKWRRIKVKLQPPKGLPPLSVYARTGYYAPSE